MNNDEWDLDEDFPLGDGTADSSADVACPHCGEIVSIAIDPGSGDMQEYIEDCQVCCNPWQVKVYFTGGDVSVEVHALDE